MAERLFLNNRLKTLRAPTALWAFIFLFCTMPASPLSVQAQTLDQPTDWQRFERSVRDGELKFPDGAAVLKSWSRKLQEAFPPQDFGKEKFFPLAGHGMNHIGGSSGEGYRPEGYCFLDGDAHKGHPAQDIFILDTNGDGLEDRTGKHANVLALADGVVLSTFGGWENRRGLRGGNYIWIYPPALWVFSYSAHLHDIMVGVGDRVRGGEPIATLGRSGKNASLPRSPTHLHVMLLEVEHMHPIDPYPWLLQASGRK